MKRSATSKGAGRKGKTVKAGTSKSAAADRRKLFVDAYIANGGNATQAAIAAGFSSKTARQQGARLLTEVAISEQIAAHAKALAEKFELTTERTLREVARLAYSDTRKLFNSDGSLKPVHELDDDTAAAVASVEVEEIGAEGVVIGRSKKIKVFDKRAALDMAMRFHGLYEKDNKQAAPVVFNFNLAGAD